MGEARQFKDFQKRVERISATSRRWSCSRTPRSREEADELRERARDGESLDDLLPEAFALCREAGKRTLKMRHFDVQLIGGMALHGGQIAEMKTGEGKTLVATLPAFLNSLAGDSVHVVTVNDYLARRDAEWMSPLYEMLGMKVGILQNMQPYEEKHVAYAADVIYGTNSEFGFDYLRDNMATSIEEVVQRDHRFAIVDEVDNILIDEARTPLIISGAPEEAADLYQKFARLAPTLVGVDRSQQLTKIEKQAEGDDPEWDYEFDEKHKTVAPTARGIAKAEQFLGIENLYMAEHGNLVNHFVQALKAESLYKRDKDYSVIDGEVKIIDEFTGRILEGRRWSEGLHQAVEAKEHVAGAGREPDAGDRHAAELLPHVRQAGRHDRNGADRGAGVPEDLQARRGRDSDQHRHGPQGLPGPDLQDQGGQVGRGDGRDHASATSAASRS